MYKLLDSLKSPDDIKKMTSEELELLSVEIRDFLIQSVSKTGGHLASNLGVVELTLSLFKVFNFDQDRIVWDVGHQCYVHKILTGRKDRFDKLKMKDGLSGFPKRSESKYDHFDTGHSSTSISAAVGMARARDLKGEGHKVIAVIGDGALTGGMTFEALNDVGFNKSNMLVILNDNQMSISHNVGGVSTYLNKIRVGPNYNKIKRKINKELNKSTVGKSISHSISKIKDSVKSLVVQSMIFEDMGIKYLGPIDGHDMKSMTEVLNKAKDIEGPVLIHVITQKGKGYEYAENNPGKYHGISPFDFETGEPKPNNKETYSKAFGDAMLELGKSYKDLVAITAAMPDGTGLTSFSKVYPERFFDVGIAEQHAVTLAAGMAVSGLRPVFAVYSTFLQRGFDQVLHDVCIQNLPVIFAIDRGGLVGEDGETHQGVFDLSYLSMIPNMTVMCPKCTEEVQYMLNWAMKQDSPIAIRYPRGGDLIEDMKPREVFEKGKWEIINEGESPVIIISTGKMTCHALMALELLKREGIDPTIINASFVKPLDLSLLNEIAKKNVNVMTIEDNVIAGGFGEQVLYRLKEEGFEHKVEICGFGDTFICQGNIEILYANWGLHPEGIYNKVKGLLK